jgi:thiamine pyrophosphate-dependent acetolactate synthase large subunit-like protein
MTSNPEKSADSVVDILETEGVEYVFGLPGSQILDIVDGVYSSEGMEFIGTHNEQGSAFMAEGYARASRGPGVCLSTVGPGATNLVTGVASAYKGYVPLLALTGKHARWQQERNTFQEIDQEELFDPVSKYSKMAAEADDLPKLTRKAFRMMTTSPRGPAHLNFPKDTQDKEIDAPSRRRTAYVPEQATRPSDEAVSSVIAQLEQADCPVIFAGYDVVWEDAIDELDEFAQALDAPVVTSCFHLDAYPTDHELSMGPIGPGFWDSANSVVEDADLVVAMGAHFDFLSTHFKDRIIPETTKKVQIHSDPENVGAVYPLEAGIACSVTGFLENANRQTKDIETRWNREDLQERKSEWEDTREQDVDFDSDPVPPATVVRAARRATPDDTQFVVDGGNFQKHVIRQMDTTDGNTYISNANFGTVGSAFPMSLGAALGSDSPVVCLTGDGGMGLNVQELETAAREEIPVTIVVFNDYGMSNVRSYQKHVYDERYTGVDFAEQEFVTIAEGFGVPGRKVTNGSDVINVIQEGMDHDGPFLVDVQTESALEKPVFMQE